MAKYVDLILGILGLVLTFSPIRKKIDPKIILSVIAGVSWNCNRILTPFASLAQEPPILFAAKIAFILVYGKMQLYLMKIK